eukprot:GHVT01029305.1.p1 GENE.GHVT01029305.1~~GHVT01029305.1.p1  ORF type:complete len:603 (+),score=123.07 GHVT01029305.1:2258-4066(+)
MRNSRPYVFLCAWRRRLQLQRSMAPLEQMIYAWMQLGALQDVFDEFFVWEAPPATGSPGDRVWPEWHQQFILRPERVPLFLPLDVAKRILLTGKSVNFIRVCGSQPSGMVPVSFGSSSFDSVPWSEDDEGEEEASLEEEHHHPSDELGWLLRLESKVHSQGRQKNQRLVRLLLGSPFYLEVHLSTIRRFLLLAEGEFVKVLLGTLHDELSQAASSVRRHAAASRVEAALRPYVASPQQQQQQQQLSSNPVEARADAGNAMQLKPLPGAVPADILARLGAELHRPCKGDKGWDVFYLDYRVVPPFHVLFTSDAMGAYRGIFALLWKLHRAAHLLGECWSMDVVHAKRLFASVPPDCSSASSSSSSLPWGGGGRLSDRATPARFAAPASREVVGGVGVVTPGDSGGCEWLRRCVPLFESHLLREELRHFFSHMLTYATHEVLETAWTALRRDLRCVQDLEQLQVAHVTYLLSIQEGLFLPMATAGSGPDARDRVPYTSSNSSHDAKAAALMVLSKLLKMASQFTHLAVCWNHQGKGKKSNRNATWNFCAASFFFHRILRPWAGKGQIKNQHYCCSIFSAAAPIWFYPFWDFVESGRCNKLIASL